MNTLDFWDNVLLACEGYLLFVLSICGICAGGLGLAFLIGLAIRRTWRWITWGMWNRVILSVEHKAFREK